MMNLQQARQATLWSTGMIHSVSLGQSNRVIGSISEPLEQSMAERDMYLEGNEGLEQLTVEGHSNAPA